MNVGSKIGKLVTTASGALHENFAGVYLFANWRFFGVLRELIFTNRLILFFLLGNFCGFQKRSALRSALIIFSCLLSHDVQYAYPVYSSFIVYRFVSE